MIQRLLDSLKALQAHPDDESIDEFADAWYLASQCGGMELTSDQRELLSMLGDALEDGSLAVQRLAGECLRSLAPNPHP